MSRFHLIHDHEGYALADSHVSMKPLRVRFDSPDYLRRLSAAGRKSELVARAVAAKAGLRVLDCTAGLGRDSFLLAHLGCHVTMLERSRVVSILLADGVHRAGADLRLADAASRVRVLRVDAIEFLRDTSERFDVIYIDPMFPKKQGSAAVKGAMQAMQNFLGTDQDALALLMAAIEFGCPRVVLKRPPTGDWVAPVQPVHVFKQRNAAYEVFTSLSG